MMIKDDKRWHAPFGEIRAPHCCLSAKRRKFFGPAHHKSSGQKLFTWPKGSGHTSYTFWQTLSLIVPRELFRFSSHKVRRPLYARFRLPAPHYPSKNDDDDDSLVFVASKLEEEEEEEKLRRLQCRRRRPLRRADSANPLLSRGIRFSFSKCWSHNVPLHIWRFSLSHQ